MILKYLGLISFQENVFYFNIGFESSKTFEVIQKNLSTSGPGISVYVGASNNTAIGRPNQTAFSPNIFWHSTELLENSLYVLLTSYAFYWVANIFFLSKSHYPCFLSSYRTQWRILPNTALNFQINEGNGWKLWEMFLYPLINSYPVQRILCCSHVSISLNFSFFLLWSFPWTLCMCPQPNMSLKKNWSPNCWSYHKLNPQHWLTRKSWRSRRPSNPTCYP